MSGTEELESFRAYEYQKGKLLHSSHKDKKLKKKKKEKDIGTLANHSKGKRKSKKLSTGNDSMLIESLKQS